MKKITVVSVAILLLMALTACSVRLTESQNAACDSADELLQGFADVADNNGIQRKMKKVDGKIVYIGTIDYAVDVNDAVATTFRDSVMPLFENLLHPEDIYVVIYLNVNGEECYRVVDTQLDSSASY